MDPYASPAPPTDLPDSVCGVLPLAATDAGPRPYALVTYPSETAAYAAGASPTNFGHCGLCSTLANLAVYMRVNDLTAPVRACGLNTSTEADNIACLQAIGFDLPCAQIYYYNTANTRLRLPLRMPRGTRRALQPARWRLECVFAVRRGPERPCFRGCRRKDPAQFGSGQRHLPTLQRSSPLAARLLGVFGRRRPNGALLATTGDVAGNDSVRGGRGSHLVVLVLACFRSGKRIGSDVTRSRVGDPWLRVSRRAGGVAYGVSQRLGTAV